MVFTSTNAQASTPGLAVGNSVYRWVQDVMDSQPSKGHELFVSKAPKPSKSSDKEEPTYEPTGKEYTS